MTALLPPLKARDIIEKYHLIPHPEGGYYVETFRSDIIVPTDRGSILLTTIIEFLGCEAECHSELRLLVSS